MPKLATCVSSHIPMIHFWFVDNFTNCNILENFVQFLILYLLPSSDAEWLSQSTTILFMIVQYFVISFFLKGDHDVPYIVCAVCIWAKSVCTILELERGDSPNCQSVKCIPRHKTQQQDVDQHQPWFLDKRYLIR